MENKWWLFSLISVYDHDDGDDDDDDDDDDDNDDHDGDDGNYCIHFGGHESFLMAYLWLQFIVGFKARRKLDQNCTSGDWYLVFSLSAETGLDQMKMGKQDLMPLGETLPRLLTPSCSSYISIIHPDNIEHYETNQLKNE